MKSIKKNIYDDEEEEEKRNKKQFLLFRSVSQRPKHCREPA